MLTVSIPTYPFPAYQIGYTRTLHVPRKLVLNRWMMKTCLMPIVLITIVFCIPCTVNAYCPPGGRYETVVCTPAPTPPPPPPEPSININTNPSYIQTQNWQRQQQQTKIWQNQIQQNTNQLNSLQHDLDNLVKIQQDQNVRDQIQSNNNRIFQLQNENAQILLKQGQQTQEVQEQSPQEVQEQMKQTQEVLEKERQTQEELKQPPQEKRYRNVVDLSKREDLLFPKGESPTLDKIVQAARDLGVRVAPDDHTEKNFLAYFDSVNNVVWIPRSEFEHIEHSEEIKKAVVHELYHAFMNQSILKMSTDPQVREMYIKQEASELTEDQYVNMMWHKEITAEAASITAYNELLDYHNRVLGGAATPISILYDERSDELTQYVKNNKLSNESRLRDYYKRLTSTPR